MLGRANFGIQALDLRIVPLSDIAQVNARHRGAIQAQLAALTPLMFTTGTTPPMIIGKLQQARSLQILRLQGHVRGAEGHRLGLDLLDPAARPDGLIVEANPGELLIGIRPFGIDRIGKVAPAPEMSAAPAVAILKQAAAAAIRKTPFDDSH